MRTFVAIDIPEEGRSIIRALQEPLRGIAGLAVSRPDQCHLTLKFLGEVHAQRVADFIAALRRIRAAPFRASFTALGAFPNAARARVIWLGVSETPALNSLASAVDRATDAVPLDKPFHPHLTLARVRRTGARVKSNVFELPVPPYTFVVSQFALYQSVLSPAGPEHTALERFSLTD